MNIVAKKIRNEEAIQLKLIKNYIDTMIDKKSKIALTTIIPMFNYINNKGETVYPTTKIWY